MHEFLRAVAMHTVIRDHQSDSPFAPENRDSLAVGCGGVASTSNLLQLGEIRMTNDCIIVYEKGIPATRPAVLLSAPVHSFSLDNTKQTLSDLTNPSV